jgi:hypothetical protein
VAQVNRRAGRVIRNGGEPGAFWPVAAARIVGTLIVVTAAAGTRTGPVRWQRAPGCF